MGRQFAVLLLVALASGGCAAVRDYVAQVDESGAMAFCESRRDNPEVKPLAGLLPIVSVDEISPEMLALETVPTPTQVKAIRALSHDQHACREKMDADAREHWPTQSATRRELGLKLDLVTAELLKRRISFGNANRLYQEAALVADGKLTDDRKEQLAQARDQESTAWRTIADGIRAIAGAPQTEQTQDPCTWAGNRISCAGN
jgi:hypothetical protein